MTNSKNYTAYHINWIDALKAFAILGILLNHAVESYHIYPWFSNPSENWLPFAERMNNIFPKDGSLFVRLIQFLGWLGDMGPGIFILASGLTLTMSALNKKNVNKIDFYKSRALRIYPLYISIHLVILIVAIFFFNWGTMSLLFWSPISMLGLRFTNSLFWFLNPSWWFIWLIIQLYLVFPYLFRLLNKKGASFFLIITLLITIISRSAGILGYTFSADMQKWMTGLFGGTRLFEFTFGMYIGYLIHTNNYKLNQILNNKLIFPMLSIATYFVGFVLSWTYWGSIFSSILITIGLSGIFYSIYEFIIKKHTSIRTPLLWIGKNSFSTFLIHQPFMIFFGNLLTGYAKLIALVIIVVSSFFSGYYIERIVNKAFPYFQNSYFSIISLFKKKIGYIFLISLFTTIFITSALILFGYISHSKIVSVLLLIFFSYLVFYRILVQPALNYFILRFIDVILFVTTIVLIFRGYWLELFGIYAFISLIILVLLKRINHWSAVFLSILLMLISTGVIEYYLKKFKPVELNSWGELPALQIDDMTTFSLIPNKVTHLKYNNYDYYIKTNSLGFTSPEINLFNKTSNEVRILIIGDAFSMPEGMEYEFSYPALLENKLKMFFPKNGIHVINAGVTGYGPNEEYAQLKKYIGCINPDIVINQLFVNEFADINMTKNNFLESIGLIQRKLNISEKLILIGQMQFPNQISSLIKNITDKNQSYNYNKSLLFFYEKDSPLYDDSVITRMNNYLQKMNELCKKNNSKYIVMGVPGQIEVSESKFISYFPNTENLNDTSRFDLDLPLQTFQDLCHKNNIVYLNSKDILKNYPEQPLYFPESWHWNKNGHEVIANYLFEYLKTTEQLVFNRDSKR